ncbi:MAG: hypothetical protein V4466_04510 [Pseudomonadota bacterium]
MKTPLLIVLLTATLAGCAGAGPRTVASTQAWCAMDLAQQGVVVTARGTQLALRPAIVPRLQRASFRSQPGTAVLSCKPVLGALTDCVVLYEEPGRQGFGKLALGYADRVIYPSGADGETAEVRFRFDAAAGRPETTCS